MNYWLLPDPHLGHFKMEKWGMRPEGFTEKILKNLAVISPDDVFVCLGDVNMGNDKYWNYKLMSSLFPTTHKWLIKGNHDRKSDTWYLSNGWDFVSDEIFLNKHGARILLSHYPIGIIQSGFRFDINVHGHFHNNPKERWEPRLRDILSNKNYLLALEEMDYKPIKMDDKFIHKIRKERNI